LHHVAAWSTFSAVGIAPKPCAFEASKFGQTSSMCFGISFSLPHKIMSSTIAAHKFKP
jgi:hypothetical protein